jgi:predicted lipoprotein with Yx(FWY)xxD motif
MEYLKMVVAMLTLALAGSVYETECLLAAEQGAGQMPPGVQTRKLESGTVVLTDAKGMTLYTFQKDSAGKSVCNDQCAKNWPPLMASADAKPMGEWTIVTRDDGTKQWAYKSRPLYTWIKDTKPGDASGHGVGMGAWEQAVP